MVDPPAPALCNQFFRWQFKRILAEIMPGIEHPSDIEDARNVPSLVRQGQQEEKAETAVDVVRPRRVRFCEENILVTRALVTVFGDAGRCNCSKVVEILQRY